MRTDPPRQLHLNVNILHSGFVPSAWRTHEADPRAFIDIDHYVRVAQIAEAGRFQSAAGCSARWLAGLRRRRGAASATTRHFRTDYEGRTLREHFGLQRPVSRHPDRREAAATA